MIGLDEVGVACLAGPVVAAGFAYSLKDSEFAKYSPAEPVRDSKQLSESQREKAQALIEKELSDRAYWSLGRAEVTEIDEINIYHASGLAMSRALQSVMKQIQAARVAAGEVSPWRAFIAIDGNKIPRVLRPLQNDHCIVPIVKGDTKVFAVAAASIFAKNFRDPFMKKLSTEFPGYGWETNVGYPTPSHKKAVTALGITPWHRRSFNLDFSAEAATSV